MNPRAVQTALLAGLAASLSACNNGDLYPQQPSGAGAGTGHAAISSGTSSGSSGTSGGSTTGQGYSCNPNPESCPSYGSLDPLNACGSDSVELVANLVEFDFENGTQPVTCPLQLTDVYNPSVSLMTDQCGYLHYCAPSGTQLSLSAQGGGYVPMNFATLLMNQSTQMPDRPGIPMVKSTILKSLSQALPGADTGLAMVIVNVQTLEAGCSESGWSLALLDSKGEGVDAGVVYLADGLPSPEAIDTDGTGIAFFYNLDSSLGTVSARGTKSGNELPDGGALCANPENGPPLWLTGRVPLTDGVISVLPFVVAP